MNQPYRLAGLADVMQLLIDGWSVERMVYADRCTLDGADGAPAAFVSMADGGRRQHLFLVDDGRTLSHRTVLQHFREHPAVWKRGCVGPEDLMGEVPDTPPQAADAWGEIPEPFPEALEISPGSLRGVMAVSQVQSVGDVSMAVTCMERFAQGMRLHYVCHAPGAGSWSDFALADLAAVDDGARMYRVAAGAIAQHGSRFAGTVVLAPQLHADARRLTLSVGAFGPRDADAAQVRGPWVFPIGVE